MKRTTEGWGSGLLAVIIFSGSLPATRVAVADFSPIFLTYARAVIAALLGGGFSWAHSVSLGRNDAIVFRSFSWRSVGWLVFHC
ncbi:hypothetical protein [Novacetimonas hansenii]|uniref:EamA domain-containing protein n=2 Tax=Novacetimonas hansenii TaxID=436 RepID=A0ABQ0SF89_NOVHA|nr:hypothetical protein [Novacetimonas hansenii]EFG84604.1 hypothetical protein GXY_07440 [Novacetimonas hansenii ATCC 23769]GAN83020.1 hypothetical protein Gaha_0057_044 [Novacetimonas hansenii JCM 7643]GBQ63417.1 hypothetical protein AA0243_3088 [Novacetimonas hansenii NRIC 0243]GEC63855.1 hypothetical protein GHA01_17040 [Novacetimonas hansenii]